MCLKFRLFFRLHLDLKNVLHSMYHSLRRRLKIFFISNTSIDLDITSKGLPVVHRVEECDRLREVTPSWKRDSTGCQTSHEFKFALVLQKKKKKKQCFAKVIKFSFGAMFPITTTLFKNCNTIPSLFQILSPWKYTNLQLVHIVKSISPFYSKWMFQLCALTKYMQQRGKAEQPHI